MASIRDLKKDINYVLGDIIEAVYVWEAHTGNKNSEEGIVIIDKAIAAFDDLIDKIHQQPATTRKAHFKTIRTQLEEQAEAMIKEVNALSKAS